MIEIEKSTIEEWINAELDAAGFDEPLYSAVKYVFSTGGKRLRPMMFLQAYSIGGKEITPEVRTVAVAIECLHQYTLIHDDLPCMDDDELRRGKPTCHKVFGEANALLAGDALLNLSHTLLLRAATTDKQAAKAGYEFSVLAGGAGVIGGQMNELNTAAFEEQVISIYNKKTCCLIWAAVYAGAIMGGLNKKQTESLKNYCFNFGLAFQIYDDLMDVTEKGCASEKSFVGCFGIEKSVEAVKNYTDAAIKSLSMSDINSNFFIDLALRSSGRKE